MTSTRHMPVVRTDWQTGVQVGREQPGPGAASAGQAPASAMQQCKAACVPHLHAGGFSEERKCASEVAWAQAARAAAMHAEGVAMLAVCQAASLADGLACHNQAQLVDVIAGADNCDLRREWQCQPGRSEQLLMPAYNRTEQARGRGGSAAAHTFGMYSSTLEAASSASRNF